MTKLLPLNPAEELLNRLKNDDHSSFTQLYNLYARKAFLVAYSATKSKETAKEIVQEVFASLWLHRKTLVINSSMSAYLNGAVKHKVYDHFDKHVVRERYKHAAALTSSPLINNTEETIAYNELSTLVQEHIGHLPETTRQVFISSRFRGSSIPEIAKESSLSVKMVEYHLTKALKYLRGRLANYQPGPTEVLILVIASILFPNK